MSIIDEFINRDRREFDYYDNVARLVADNLQLALDSAGVRAIVTFRAKSPTRLESKVRQRHARKKYRSVAGIFKDIVDLAGVRVALYFPAQRGEVDQIIRATFKLLSEPKNFPTDETPPYEKRFSGYRATHYRVALKKAALSDAQLRYGDASVEIQTASVLMHAWAEVEHDLVYKPMQGKLSIDEYAILDELNGLVLAGELALERLQRAGEARVSTKGRRFENHFELAAYLIERVKSIFRKEIEESTLGRVDFLFEFLRKLNKLTPDQLDSYLIALKSDFETRPLAEQIVDLLLSEQPEHYASYESIRSEHKVNTKQTETSTPNSTDLHTAIGFYLQQWQEVERFLRKLAEQNDIKQYVPISKLISHLPALKRENQALQRVRHFRNILIHGREPLTLQELHQHTTELEQVLKSLKKRFPNDF